MRIKLSEPTSAELRAALVVSFATRVFISLMGLCFAGIGAVFVFASLPHTENLVMEWSGEQVKAWKSQALDGRWTVSSRESVFRTNACASVARHEDEGTTTYRTVLEGEGEKWHLGKSLADRGGAEALAERINRFLADPKAEQLVWEQRTFWWFMSPFGIGGILVGLVLIGAVWSRERWDFTKLRGEMVRRRSFFCWHKMQRWPLRTIQLVFFCPPAHGPRRRHGQQPAAQVPKRPRSRDAYPVL